MQAQMHKIVRDSWLTPWIPILSPMVAAVLTALFLWLATVRETHDSVMVLRTIIPQLQETDNRLAARIEQVAGSVEANAQALRNNIAAQDAASVARDDKQWEAMLELFRGLRPPARGASGR